MKIGFLSDAHGNFSAFLKGIDVLERQAVNKIFFLGDAIGYFDSPEIVYYLNEKNIFSLRGNHEDMLLTKKIPDQKEKFYRLSQHLKNKKLIDIISQWPEEHTLTIDFQKIKMLHGSMNDPIYGYTYQKDADSTIFDKNLNLFVCGATHRPFIYKKNNTIIANIGSCGYPRDYGKYASLGIYDTNLKEFEILRYDISQENKRIIENHPNLELKVKETFLRAPPEKTFVGKII